MSEKKTMTVREMGDLLGLRKTDRYWLVHKNFFKTEQVDGITRVDIASFEKWYANQVKYRKITGEEPGRELKRWSYSVQEAAELLDVSDDKVYKLIKASKLETVKVDFVLRIPKECFWQWYEKQDQYRTVSDRLRDAILETRTITMPQMAALLGISRNEAYRILRSDPRRNLFEFIYIGQRKRITKESFEQWYAGQEKYRLADGKEISGTAEEKDAALAMHRTKRHSMIRKGRTAGNLQYLTREEAALLGNVSKTMVSYWYEHGMIPVKKFGSLIRIPREEYELFLWKRMKEKVRQDGIDS